MSKRLFVLNGAAAVLAAAVAVTVVVTAPGADAAVVQPIGRTVQSFTPSADVMHHSADAAAGGWSVIASSTPVDVTVRRPDGQIVGVVPGATPHTTNFLAMDHRAGHHPLGRYSVDVSHHAGFDYQMQFLDGGSALVPGQPTVVGTPDRPWMVELREISLRQGDRLSLAVTGAAVASVSFMHVTEGVPYSWTVTESTADRTFQLGKAAPTDVNTVTFTAPATANYAVVFEHYWWEQTAAVTPTLKRGLILPGR